MQLPCRVEGTPLASTLRVEKTPARRTSGRTRQTRGRIWCIGFAWAGGISFMSRQEGDSEDHNTPGPHKSFLSGLGNDSKRRLSVVQERTSVTLPLHQGDERGGSLRRW